MAKKSDAVEKKGSSAVVGYDYGEDAGSGYENQTKADTSLPFIVLLQALSPIVVDGKAKSGQFMNTVTEEVFDEFLFVAGTTRNHFAEWTPRDQGGGFHGHHEIDSPEVAEAVKNASEYGKNMLPNGNQLVETFYVYGISVDSNMDPTGMMSMAFKSTAIRAYKRWNTTIKMFMFGKPNRPPLFAHLNKMTSQQKKNDKGVFYVPHIGPAHGNIADSLLAPDNPLFAMAKQAKLLVDSGDAQIDPNQQEAQGNDSGGTGEVPF